MNSCNGWDSFTYGHSNATLIYGDNLSGCNCLTGTSAAHKWMICYDFIGSDIMSDAVGEDIMVLHKKYEGLLMRQIAKNIFQADKVRSSNVYLLVSGTDLALIDCGMHGEANLIISEISEAGFDLADLKIILVTHAHLDHAGNCAELARYCGASVMAHYDDMPYLEGTKTMPTRTLLQKLVFRLAPGVPSVKTDQILDDGDMVEVMGGLQVVHTPGHTPGSICFYQPQRGILFYGDALGRKRNHDGGLTLSDPPPHFTYDVEAARKSAGKLAELPVTIYCPGHRRPFTRCADGNLRIFEF